MWASIAKAIAGVVQWWNEHQREKREDAIETRGRQLQNVDRLSQTVQEAINARKSDADLGALSDSDLDRELRGGTEAGAGHG